MWPRSKTVRVPRDHGSPSDLPPWARDEMVRLRIAEHDLRTAFMKERFFNAHIAANSTTREETTMTQDMDSITRRALERLAERPVIDEQVYNEEIRYCWVDEDSQRVGPVHKDFGKALSWISNWPDKVRQLEGWKRGDGSWPHSPDSIEKLERSVSLTGKAPAQLKRVVTRTVGESLADYEVVPVEAAMKFAGLTS